MSMDLTGITNQNEYYTNHYFSSIFEENASETISAWRAEAKESEEIRTPWALLRDVARQYYPAHDRFLRSKFDTQTLVNIRSLADMYLRALGYPEAKPEWIEIDDTLKAPVYLELTKANGAPALWILLATSDDKEAAILDKFCFAADEVAEEGLYSVPANILTDISNEDLITKILFGQAEPPRFILLIDMNQIALIDRNKWNEKRYLQFELEDIFSRHEESTLQAMAVLLHRNSLCPEDGTALLDELDANSQKHAAGVSQDLKYALRESIEILGNEVLYDMVTRQGRNLETDPVDAGDLTLECLRYMYRMLFVLFIEARPELGYAPIQNLTYKSGYSLDNLRDIADDIRDDVTEVGDGYFLHETLSKLYNLIYSGYPETEEDLLKYSQEESLHDMFVIAPLKAHIFDPDYTKMITKSKLRNSCMLRIIDLMSLTRETGRRNDRRGRISYANLGINQMGSVYEALLSYRGFIAETTLFEVKRAGDSFNELDVGYFVTEDELNQYTEDERVRYEKNDPDGKYKKGQLRKYEKGTFIYRLAGREREKSASYYTPEVLTKCLVKYALKDLLEGKTADEILHLTICEPAMGSAAFLNEAITQLAEAYLDKKQKERGEMIPANDRLKELQKVKMYMADRNVYGIDLNPVAVELAEVSLWLNTIYEGGFVPWFGTQLINGNSLIGARRQVYRVEALSTTSKGLRWYENALDRVPLGTKRMPRKQVYHFLLGDLSVISYEDNKTLIEYFGSWKTIQVKLPAIAEVIGAMANKKHVMIAKMDSYVKDLIDKGIYRFTIDKQGEILPTIRDADGFVKQVRLEDMSLTPNLTQSLNNLSTHVVMAQILDEIEYVADAIREIHIELQNDRLAMAESSRDKLKQARMIQDAKLREIALIGVVNSATDAKRTLMRNFSQNISYIIEHSHKSDLQLILSPKGERDISQKAIDSFQALVYITNAVQIECEGYAMLGEYEPCRECLSEFKTFIEDNGLNKRDTLLLLNENSSQKRIEIVDEFSDIAARISSFDISSGQIEFQMRDLLTATDDGGENDDQE